MASKRMSLILHPDKNRFLDWVQNSYEDNIDSSGIIDKARRIMQELWINWNETKDNLIDRDQGILQKAGPTTVHKETQYLTVSGLVHVQETTPP